MTTDGLLWVAAYAYALSLLMLLVGGRAVAREVASLACGEGRRQAAVCSLPDGNHGENNGCYGNGASIHARASI